MRNHCHTFRVHTHIKSDLFDTFEKSLTLGLRAKLSLLLCLDIVSKLVKQMHNKVEMCYVFPRLAST